MQSSSSDLWSRRNVLKTTGVVGVASLAGMSGTAAAKPERKGKGNNFGNGHGVGAFLNEQAAYKPAPVWRDGVVDMTDRAAVEVVVGAMTRVEMPDAPVDELPVAFAPQAVTIAPGTAVTWTWPTYPAPVPPIPHDVVSLDDGRFDSGVQVPGGPDFTHTFDDAGIHLYYCTPHGAPFPVHPHGAPPDVRIYNEFGMRGAVIVVED